MSSNPGPRSTPKSASESVVEMASRIRLLAIEEEACHDLDDRIGCRMHREQAERDLGRLVASLHRCGTCGEHLAEQRMVITGLCLIHGIEVAGV